MTEQADRLQTLNEIGRVVSSTLDLGTLYETIYRQVGRVMDTTHFFIALSGPERPQRVPEGGASGPWKTVDVPYLREEGTLFLDQIVSQRNSVTGLVIQHGTPLLFDCDDDYNAYAVAQGVQIGLVGEKETEAKIWVPLNTGSRTIGALSVQSSRVNAYTQEDVQILSVIASQAAVAIVNAALYQQSLDNVRQTQALLQVARSINSSLQPDAVLDAILAGMREVIPYYVAAILLPNHARGYLDIAGTVGPLANERRRVLKVPFGQGVTGVAFSTGEPQIVQNVREYPGYVPTDDAVHSELAIPLKRGDQVIGVLDIEREEVDAFSREDLNLLSLFASQAAIAIENARLFAEQRQRVFELQTIQAIVHQLTPLHGPPRVLPPGEIPTDARPPVGEIPTGQIPVVAAPSGGQPPAPSGGQPPLPLRPAVAVPPQPTEAAIAAVIDTELKHLIAYHACRIFLLDPSHQELLPLSATGGAIARVRLSVGEGVAGWIAQRGEAVIINDALADPRTLQIPGTPRREESIMGAPLIYEGRVQGVITLSKLGTHQFDENALRLLEIVAGQAAIVLDRARLYAELRRDAITDPLTRVYNRRYLLERCKEEAARAQRTHHPLAALMLDLDKFKQINDGYGHGAGDVVLQEVAGIIRAVVRTEDSVARYGGEEFCVLVPELPGPEAEQVADRMRRRIAQHRFPEAAGVRQVTVSVGVAHLCPTDRESTLFQRADLAMYAGKRLGGNRVYVAQEDGTFRPLAVPTQPCGARWSPSSPSDRPFQRTGRRS